MSPLLRSDRGVTLIGGGPVAAEDVDEAVRLAPAVMAADSGAETALALGLIPEAVAGDLDSLSAAARAKVSASRLHRIGEQDSTDFEKCLTRIDAPFVLAVGFTGGRVDHLLACLTTLVRVRSPRCLLLSPDDLILAAPSRLSLDLPRGTRLSLYPLGRVTGRSTGLRWPIDGLVLKPTGLVGTSNETTGPVTIDLDGPCIAILPRAHLRAAMAALGVSAP